MIKNLSGLLASGAVMLASFITSPAIAATYTVDSSLSSVFFSFNLGPTFLVPQSVGADTAFYGGTVEASVPLGGGLLTLDSTGGFGDSNIIALNNSAGPFLPAVGGAVAAGDDEVFADGSEDVLNIGDGVFTSGPENYGLSLFGVAFAAVRGLELTVEGSGTTGGAATGIGWNIAAGWTAINSLALGGGLDESFVGETAVDPEYLNTGGVIGYSLVGTTETITLPIDFAITDGANAYTFLGSIVASRTVAAIPEPTSGLFLASLAAGAGAVVRRRRA